MFEILNKWCCGDMLYGYIVLTAGFKLFLFRIARSICSL